MKIKIDNKKINILSVIGQRAVLGTCLFENENNFENYRVIEMYYKENVISIFLENFFLKDNKLVCDKLDTNLVSILPIYLSSC